MLHLRGDGVNVTGTVDDVRPYLQHAAAVVAPLRLARGIQNKVLEAMAMGRPVVASASCAAPIDAVVGTELLAASDAEGFAAAGVCRPCWPLLRMQRKSVPRHGNVYCSGTAGTPIWRGSSGTLARALSHERGP